MGTDKRIAAAIALIKKHRPNILKKNKKKKFASMLTMELIFLHGKLSLPHFTKGKSFRWIKLRMIKHPRFKKILDEHFKGDKRVKFDDPAPKPWTTRTVIQDIRTKGQYARFKLVERHIGKYLNKKILSAIHNLENYQEWANKAKHKDYKKPTSRK